MTRKSGIPKRAIDINGFNAADDARQIRTHDGTQQRERISFVVAGDARAERQPLVLNDPAVKSLGSRPRCSRTMAVKVELEPEPGQRHTNRMPHERVALRSEKMACGGPPQLKRG